MKLKQIESILKSRKTIFIMQSSGGQWLSDGSAMYPVYNLPRLTQDNIYALFDIVGEQQDKYLVEIRELPGFINFTDSDVTGRMLDRASMYLTVDGQMLEPLETSQGLVFIQRKYLKPFTDLADGVELYERTDLNGNIYIAVKSGFLLMGVIMPYRTINAKFIRTLDRWAKLSNVALLNMAHTKTELIAPEQQELDGVSEDDDDDD